jgi:DNA-directed RNA polymerase specialized sigma24 family protein
MELEERSGGAGALTREQLDAMVVSMVQAHADGLLRLARRHSLCPDDAHDAYQRGLEIFLRHAPRLDPERAPSWLRTVV